MLYDVVLVSAVQCESAINIYSPSLLSLPATLTPTPPLKVVTEHRAGLLCYT